MFLLYLFKVWMLVTGSCLCYIAVV